MHQVVEIEEKDVIQKIELFANYLSPTDLKRNLKKEYERIYYPFLANQPHFICDLEKNCFNFKSLLPQLIQPSLKYLLCFYMKNDEI